MWPPGSTDHLAIELKELCLLCLSWVSARGMICLPLDCAVLYLEGPRQLLPSLLRVFLSLVSGPHLDSGRGGSLQDLHVNADMAET